MLNSNLINIWNWASLISINMWILQSLKTDLWSFVYHYNKVRRTWNRATKLCLAIIHHILSKMDLFKQYNEAMLCGSNWQISRGHGWSISNRQSCSFAQNRLPIVHDPDQSTYPWLHISQIFWFAHHPYAYPLYRNKTNPLLTHSRNGTSLRKHFCRLNIHFITVLSYHKHIKVFMRASLFSCDCLKFCILIFFLVTNV